MKIQLFVDFSYISERNFQYLFITICSFPFCSRGNFGIVQFFRFLRSEIIEIMSSYLNQCIASQSRITFAFHNLRLTNTEKLLEVEKKIMKKFPNLLMADPQMQKICR